MAELSQDLLRILECPVAHVPVVQAGVWICSTDSQTRRRYPIRDGIPIMLIEESQVVEPAAFEETMVRGKPSRTSKGDNA